MSATEQAVRGGLVFQHFIHNAKYTVRPAAKSLVNGIPMSTAGLRVEFEGHRWDSKQAQARLGWTDEERRLVEQYMLDHPDFGMARGMSLEGHTIEAMRERPVTVKKLTLRCAAFFRDPDSGESVQCELEPADGEDYCSAHLGEIQAALTRSIPDEPDVPETLQPQDVADFLGADSLDGDQEE